MSDNRTMTSSSSLSLRERKKDRTRRDLVRVGLQLFSERGFTATTVDEIADRAEYARATFFRYFRNKEDIVFSSLEEKLAASSELLSAGESSGRDPIDVLHDWISMTLLSATVEASELEAAKLELIRREPELQRRYLEILHNAEETIVVYLADAWGVDPQRSIECQVVASALVGVGKAIVRSNSRDRPGVLEALKRGFEVLELGIRPGLAINATVASPTGAKGTNSRRGR